MAAGEGDSKLFQHLFPFLNLCSVGWTIVNMERIISILSMSDQ
jgi:hypothetical protein